MTPTLSIAGQWTVSVLKAIPWVAASTVFINDHVLEVRDARGKSMAPTLSPTYDTTGQVDWVLYRKWDAGSGLQRGDVVFYCHPIRPEDAAVKRIIAVDGDTVLLDARRRPRGEGGESRSWDAWGGRVSVPAGHVWVEGDNWRESFDSNYHGPISKAMIEGKAMAIFRPWKRSGMKPWEGYRSETGVVRAVDGMQGDPELMEATSPHAPP